MKLLGYGLIAPATAALLVVTSVGALQNIGPAWAAHEGHGMRGTFFAVVQHCSKNCWWTRTFSPNAPVNARPGVTLASGTDVSGVGAAVAAIDSGAPGTVYRTLAARPERPSSSATGTPRAHADPTTQTARPVRREW